MGHGSTTSSGDRNETKTKTKTKTKKKKKKKKKKTKKKFVKWAWRKRPGVSLAEMLFTAHFEAGNCGPDETPQHLQDLFSTIFASADTNNDGLLSTLELIRMLGVRAKETFKGDSHAIFKLKTQLQKAGGGDEHADLTVELFATGLMEVAGETPDGAVAQWLLAELQAEASSWSVAYDAEHESEYYVHDTTDAWQWEKPAIVAEMEWCARAAADGIDAASGGAVSSAVSRSDREDDDVAVGGDAAVEDDGAAAAAIESSSSSSSSSSSEESASDREDDDDAGFHAPGEVRELQRPSSLPQSKEIHATGHV